MISRSTDWDRFIAAIVEHLGADPKDVRPGSAALEMGGGDHYVTFTCSFLIAPSELNKIQAQIKETA